MAERRPKNSEQLLRRLEEEEEKARLEEGEKGILEIFDRPEDEPLVRDEDE